MKVGLVGFQASGKSTVFTAVAGQASDPGRGALASARVPDLRLAPIAEHCHPRRIVEAELGFADLPSGHFPPPGATIAPATLAEMRTLDVLAEVIDGFSGSTDPVSASTALSDELLLADLGVVEKRLDRLDREGGQGQERELLETCKGALEEGSPLARLDMAAGGLERLSGFRFLTLKPRIVIINVDEAGLADGLAAEAATATALGIEAHSLAVMSAPIECELAALDGSDQPEFLADLGLEAPARDRFIRACYQTLDLITFFTAGEKELRAWSLARNEPAVSAAGEVHSDIARGFIRAEVISYDDYVGLGGEAASRDAGKLRLEGRDYIVSDGDVIHFRFNV